jgi:uncharacterized repeat protein (TIGR02543 family)
MKNSFAFIVPFLAAALACPAAPILLKSGAIEPQAEAAPAARSAKSLAKTSSAAGGVYIIQHDGLITDAWRESLTAAGAKIFHYIPENAYVISASAGALAKIKAAVPHTYLGEYKPAYKIAAEAGTAAKTMALTKTAATAEAAAVYTVSLFDASDREAAAAAIAATAGCSVLSQDGTVIRAGLTAEGLGAAAEIAGVEWVAPYHERRLCNDVAVQAPRMNVETVWPGGDTGLGLTGAGQAVAVCDTGLDTGSQSTLHRDIRGRVTRTFALGRANDWSDTDGHGTHVCGSVAGDGTMSSSPKIRGVAYGCSLILQSVMDSKGGLGGIPDDLNASLFPQAYEDDSAGAGARIHSNSWGTEDAGEYTIDSQAVDKYTFAHPDFLVIVAAGNEAVDKASPYGVVDTGSIDAPATAKNCIAVGASENYRTTGGYSKDTWKDFGFRYSPITSDYISRPYDGQHQGMCPASCRGPCLDGRTKPDVVAPGTDILSMKSSVVVEDPNYDYSELYYNDYYWFSTGTSMATPLVAGSAALIREWLQTYYAITNPLASTVKALLIAGAKSLSPGQYGTGSKREIPASYPNNVEGWGQVNLGDTCAASPTLYDGAAITNGETQYVSVIVPTNTADFCAVMAYCDAPASPGSSKQLVNDLDLTVMKPDGTLVYPNSGASADRLNNVEGVRIPNAPAGVYWIEVDGHNIPQPMSPSLTGEPAAQLFSLVINGAEVITSQTVQMSGPATIESGKPDYCTCELLYNGTYPVDVSADATWSATPAELVSVKAGILTTSRILTNATVTVTAEYDGSVVSMDITLTPFTTTATFDAAGGTPATVTITETGGAPFVLPAADPVRSGYVFDGWWSATAGGTQITSAEIVTDAAARTFHAHWLKAYVLTIDGSSRSVLQGDIVPLNAIVPNGRVFSGWSVSPTGTELGATFDPRSASTFLTMPAADVALATITIAAPAYIAVTATEQNATANAPATPVGIQWSTDGLVWTDTDGVFYPAPSGFVTLSFRSGDARWAAPATQTLSLAPGASTTVSASAIRRVLVSVAAGDSGSGAVALSPADGILGNGKAAALTARAATGSIFVDWRDANGDLVSATASLKVIPTADTVYTARFRLKTDCAEPAPSFAAAMTAIAGVQYTAAVSVQDAALPVRYSATRLPTGLKIDASTGVISGVPTRAGTFNTAITAVSRADIRKKAVFTQAITVEALPGAAVGTFIGSADDPAIEAPSGRNAILTFTATATGRLTAKLVSTNGTTSATARSWSAATGSVFYAVLTSKKTGDIPVTLDASRGWQQDQLEGTAGGLALTARRNPFLRDTPAEASSALGLLLGSYTAAIPAAPCTTNDIGAALNAPAGNGWFSLSVKARGISRLSGTLPDGTRLSASGVIAIDTNGVALLKAFVPLYSRRGFWTADIRINPSAQPPLDVVYGLCRQCYAGKSASADANRFDVTLGITGGLYNRSFVTTYATAALAVPADATPGRFSAAASTGLFSLPLTLANGTRATAKGILTPAAGYGQYQLRETYRDATGTYLLKRTEPLLLTP